MKCTLSSQTNRVRLSAGAVTKRRLSKQRGKSGNTTRRRLKCGVRSGFWFLNIRTGAQHEQIRTPPLRRIRLIPHRSAQVRSAERQGRCVARMSRGVFVGPNRDVLLAVGVRVKRPPTERPNPLSPAKRQTISPERGFSFFSQRLRSRSRLFCMQVNESERAIPCRIRLYSLFSLFLLEKSDRYRYRGCTALHMYAYNTVIHPLFSPADLTTLQREQTLIYEAAPSKGFRDISCSWTLDHLLRSPPAQLNLTRATGV